MFQIKLNGIFRSLDLSYSVQLVLKKKFINFVKNSFYILLKFLKKYLRIGIIIHESFSVISNATYSLSLLLYFTKNVLCCKRLIMKILHCKKSAIKIYAEKGIRVKRAECFMIL